MIVQNNIRVLVTSLMFCSPLNCDAGNILRANDMLAYRSMAKMYCIEYCRVHKPSNKLS